jgi:hypothetical protein
MSVLDNDLILPSALAQYQLGHDVVLLRYGTKIAAWPEWQKHVMDRTTLQGHLRRKLFNLGLLLGSQDKRGPPLCVLDKDAASREVYNLMRKHRVYHSPMEVQTRYGIHVYFRLPETVKDVRSRIKFLGLPLDVKMTGYAVAPPSWMDETEWRYEYREGTQLVPPEELPMLPESFVELLNQERRPVPAMADIRFPRTIGIRNPEAYAMKIESVQGCNGSGQLVRVVCCLRDCGRSSEETLAFLKEKWNPVCAKPPWSDRELEHCVRRMFKESRNV